jgi:protein TonB
VEAAVAESSSDLLLSRSGSDRRVMGLALGLAIGLHLAVLLLVVFPEREAPRLAVENHTSAPLIRVAVPLPPPRLRPPRPDRAPTDRMLPVPDPVPSRPEPIGEPVPEAVALEVSEAPVGLPEVVGDPEPPPISMPYELSDRTITPPVLVESSKVDPRYPARARVARVSGRVTLRAVITENGSVREVEVEDCDRPGYGLEQAAIEAVEQWRYRPAVRRGTTVPVYLIVDVSFSLH